MPRQFSRPWLTAAYVVMDAGAAFDELHQSVVVDERRVSTLRFSDPWIQAVLAAILLHALLSMGFNNRQMRKAVAQLLVTEAYGTHQATYDLRRLRLRGLIEHPTANG